MTGAPRNVLKRGLGTKIRKILKYPERPVLQIAARIGCG